MTKTELRCVQKLSIQLRNRAADLWIRNSLIASATIDFIADDRMLEPGEVHANLMRASGLQLNVKQRKPIEAFSISASSMNRMVRLTACLLGLGLAAVACQSQNLKATVQHSPSVP